MQSIFEILFLFGNHGKISKVKKPFEGEIKSVISQERKIEKSSNLVKFVFRSVKN